MTDSAPMTYSTLTTENGVARLTLNRPEVHNAFDDSLIAELNEHLHTLHKLATTGEVRVVVLGSEGKSFSAGADLNWMKRIVDYDLEDNLADSRKLSALMHGLDTLPCPTVCRVQGAAYGGAVGLAACCDVVIASDKAKFCLSEVKIGLSPAVISPYVQRALGERQMRRYALTAEIIDAPTSLALGLTHQVVEHETLDTAVDTMIATLLAGSPQAQRTSKALMATVAQAPDADKTREHTCQVIAKLRVSPEGQEGLSSFFEKRRPAWAESNHASHASERRS